MAKDDLLIRNYLADNMTRRAFNESEVFREYVKAEMARDAYNKKAEALQALSAEERGIDEENQVLDQLDAFRKKVAENPALARKLKMAKEALEAHPELVEKVDPRFIDGIKLLDLE